MGCCVGQRQKHCIVEDWVGVWVVLGLYIHYVVNLPVVYCN